MSESGKFEQWAVVEVLGHETYAGLVGEAVIGGCHFIRVDVPALPAVDYSAAQEPFSKLLGQNAIFSITPCTEEVALAVAHHKRSRPLKVYIPPLKAIAGREDDDPYIFDGMNEADDLDCTEDEEESSF